MECDPVLRAHYHWRREHSPVIWVDAARRQLTVAPNVLIAEGQHILVPLGLATQQRPRRPTASSAYIKHIPLRPPLLGHLMVSAQEYDALLIPAGSTRLDPEAHGHHSRYIRLVGTAEAATCQWVYSPGGYPILAAARTLHPGDLITVYTTSRRPLPSPQILPPIPTPLHHDPPCVLETVPEIRPTMPYTTPCNTTPRATTQPTNSLTLVTYNINGAWASPTVTAWITHTFRDLRTDGVALVDTRTPNRQILHATQLYRGLFSEDDDVVIRVLVPHLRTLRTVPVTPGNTFN